MPIGLEAADHVEELEGRLRIEARGRLVEDRDLGAFHDHLGKTQPPLHAVRERPDLFVADATSRTWRTAERR